jgi:hypothetical protein
MFDWLCGTNALQVSSGMMKSDGEGWSCSQVNQPIWVSVTLAAPAA